MSLLEEVYNWKFTGNLSHSNFTIDRAGMELVAPFVMSMVIFILTVLLGVLGNGAVIWVTGFKMKTNAHTVCFLNLAMADLVYCLCLLLLMAEFYSGESGIIHWQIFGTIMFLNAFASIFLLCLISIYRRLAVTRPIWFWHHLSLARARATCFMVWVIVTAMWLPPIILHFPPVTMKILAAFIFGLPFVIMIISYAVVDKRLRGERFSKSRKPVCLLVTAVAAFLICWLPFSLDKVLPDDFQFFPPDWFIFFHALASFNRALNPLIYVFAGSDFRQVFKRSLFASLQLAFTEQEQKGETQNRNPASNTNV